MSAAKYVLWFNQISKDDIPSVGGKGANLGEMTRAGIPVPSGFVVTAQAYFDFLEAAKIKDRIAAYLSRIDTSKIKSLEQTARKIRRVIRQAPIPEKIAQEIMKSYLKLGKYWGLKQAYVAVRSSATAEDLPDASFAGQQQTFLNVRGEASVVKRVRDCWASLFTGRAIFYREKNKFDHFKVGIAVPIQKMVQSDVSGIIFTVDPVTNNKKSIVIEAVWGLGETIVQGQITPDYYRVNKEDFRIEKIEVNPQTVQLVKTGNRTVRTSVPKHSQKTQKLNSLTIVKLAQIAEKIHRHYFYPQDIEFAMEKNQIYIVQTRPITTLKTKNTKSESENTKANLVLEGEPASPGIASGRVKIVKNLKQLAKVKKGDILVTDMTTPDYVPAMQLVNGIITNKGGQTSHAAIVSRELSIPCVVGTKTATQTLKEGEEVSLDGKTGKVFRGNMLGKPKKILGMRVVSFPRTATKLYVNLGEPLLAKKIAQKRVDGVGLLRAEFMIANIGVHPRKLIEAKKGFLFTDKLAEGMTKFCRAFSPRPVIYRATDFKTNEYRNLEGGEKYEPKEENPMLGFRGAVRYIKAPDVFELELEAIKKVRNKMGLKNLWLMIPFVRTPAELIQVKRIIASVGLNRTPSFKLIMMVEIPSNIILLEDFIEAGIDGVSIGSNDLTMLILGLDRDNQEIAFEFDERNKAILWSLKRAIEICNRHHISSSICGQAPSNFPDLVEKLVRWGITSVSVNPDAIETTARIIAKAEKKVLGRKTKKH